MTSTPRTAIVTGATSGIGLAVARELANRGHRVFICARNGERVAETAKQLSDNGNLPVDGQACDVRSLDDIRAMVRAAVERFGTIGILVNNAGRGGGGVTADIPDDLWDDVLATNLTSVFRVTREVLTTGGMREASWGRIINIASTAGKQGVVLGAPYSASKHGVVGFTKALGNELAPTGITVNAVCPGYVETPMAEAVRQRYAQAWQISEDEVLARIPSQNPARPLLHPRRSGRTGRLPHHRDRSVDHFTGTQRLRRPRQLLTTTERTDTMQPTGSREDRHTIVVQAPAARVYELIADVEQWPQLFPPTIHAERIEHSGNQERIRIWATANGDVKEWTSRRTLDPAARRIDFRRKSPHPPSPPWADLDPRALGRAQLPGRAPPRLPGRRRRPGETGVDQPSRRPQQHRGTRRPQNRGRNPRQRRRPTAQLRRQRPRPRVSQGPLRLHQPGRPVGRTPAPRGPGGTH